MMIDDEHECVGICTFDENGVCIGCGYIRTDLASEQKAPPPYPLERDESRMFPKTKV